MKPPKIPSKQQAYEALGTTIGRLFSAFNASILEARDYVELKGRCDRSFFSHQVRYLANVELRNDSYETEDCDLEDTANSGICLVQPGYRIRVLRAAEDGQIPDPGESVRRQRFLSQQSEQGNLDFGPEEKAAPSVDEPTEPTHIVLLWEADSRNKFHGFWFICPNGTHAVHFRDWLPIPRADDLGLPIREPQTPPQEPPPTDLGYTKKEEKPKAQPKTGTESAE